MSTTLHPAGAPYVAHGPVIGSGPLLVATDASESSDGALRAALVLGKRLGASVEVMTVIDPMPIVTPEIQLPLSAALEEERRADRLARVRGQLSRVTGSETAWPLTVSDGQPVMEILRRARDSHARLILVGLGRHAMMDRLFGDEAALQLLRMATVPIYGAGVGAGTLPKTIVAAVDFSRGAVRALRAAAEIADEHATLYLLNAITREMTTAVWEDWREAYSKGVADSFEELRQQLELPPTMTIETRLLNGDPAHEVLRFAREMNADLIVTGSHGHGFFSRMLLGSTATRIVRGSACSVLGVPRTALDTVGFDGFSAAERPATRIPANEWAEQLEELTRRDTGRRTTLEVDEPTLGAQAQESDYPLLGIAYDKHDARLEIMLGELEAGGPHLTRNIAGVTAIDLLRDGQGRDVALRVEHGAGQTLLTFAR